MRKLKYKAKKGFWQGVANFCTHALDVIFPSPYSDFDRRYPTTFPTRQPLFDRPKVDIPTFSPQETVMAKPNLNVRVKALDTVRNIFSTMSQIDSCNEDEMMMALRELRRLGVDYKDQPTYAELINHYTKYIEDILKNVYITAEELLKEARENDKGYAYNGKTNIFYLSGQTTIRGTSKKEYYTLTTTKYGGKTLLSCNAFGWTDEFPSDYAQFSSLDVALGHLARDCFRGETFEKDGILMAKIKLFPHKIDKSKKKVITPPKVEEPAKTELPPQNHLKPLDKVSSSPGGQQLQPVT
jgi:hypothetical protein